MKFDMKCELCTLVDLSGKPLCQSCEEMVKRLIVIEKRVNGCTIHLTDETALPSGQFSAASGKNR